MGKHDSAISSSNFIQFVIFFICLGFIVMIGYPKLICLKKDAYVSSMVNDINIIHTIVNYYGNENEKYPLKNKIEKNRIDMNMLELLKKFNDSGDNIYEIDMDKIKNYHTKLKIGYQKYGRNDIFVYSLETNRVFYLKGVEDGNGNKRYTLYMR